MTTAGRRGPAAGVRLTHVGGPTVLVETAGWRLLTDPTFDPPGRRYGFGWGTSSRKTAGPALPASAVLPVDVVLLSHDHHADNLDDAGRELLRSAGVVVTTAPGSRRLGGPDVRGLVPWTTTRITGPGRPALEVTATPARHGPPLSRPIAGSVVGFAVRVAGRPGALWVSGDTVPTRGVRQVARRFDVDTALVHLGGVRFPVTGPVRYSMTGAQAVRLLARLCPRVAVPVHYEGWSHFREGEERLRAVLDRAPADVRSRVRWLQRGVPWEAGDLVD